MSLIMGVAGKGDTRSLDYSSCELLRVGGYYSNNGESSGKENGKWNGNYTGVIYGFENQPREKRKTSLSPKPYVTLYTPTHPYITLYNPIYP